MATIPTKKISELTTKTDTPTTETYVPVAEKTGEAFATKKYDLQRIYTALNGKLDATAKAADSDKLDGNDSTYFATATNLTSHTSNTNNPHNVTAAQLGAANILNQIKTVDGAGSGLDADLLDGIQSTDFSRVVERASATVGPGWVTVAEAGHRNYCELYIIGDAYQYPFINVTWERVHQNSSIVVKNISGYDKSITGIRILEQSSDKIYGPKKLQVYITVSKTLNVVLISSAALPYFGVPTIVTPIVQNTIEGYTVLNEVTKLDKVSFATSQGLITPLILSSEKENTSTSSTVAIDWRTGNLQSLTLTQNTTVTFASPSAPCNLQLRVIQDATGGRTITLPTLKKANGTTISFTTTANAVDLLQLYFDGTNYIVTDFIKDIV